MKKYIRFKPLNDMINEQETEFEYEVGEIITVNSTEIYKCISLTKEEDNIFYNFKQGKKTYNFDW